MVKRGPNRHADELYQKGKDSRTAVFAFFSFDGFPDFSLTKCGERPGKPSNPLRGFANFFYYQHEIAGKTSAAAQKWHPIRAPPLCFAGFLQNPTKYKGGSVYAAIPYLLSEL